MARATNIGDLVLLGFSLLTSHVTGIHVCCVTVAVVMFHPKGYIYRLGDQAMIISPNRYRYIEIASQFSADYCDVIGYHVTIK